MRTRLVSLSVGLGFSLVALLLTGCGTSQPTQFYLLSSSSASGQPGKAGMALGGISIGLGPVEVPQYLNRPQIVTRTSPHELELAQFHKWAEPLQDTISRVLAENLSALLHTEHIYTFPRRSTSEVDYQVVIQITRFDASPSGDATLDAHWQIMSGQDKEVLVMDKSHITNLPTSSGYPGTVSAMSENLSDLSRAIATSLNSLQRERR